MKKIKILIAGTHSMMLLGLQSLISSKTNLQCIGEAKNGSEMIEMCSDLKPDRLLIDLSLPDLNPALTLSQLHNQFPQMNILIFSTSTDEAGMRDLIESGVKGFVLIDETQETWGCAIEAVSQGDTWFSKETIQKLTIEKSNSPATGDEVHLTDRELNVLRLLAQGYSNKKIAQQLCVSEPDVRFHLRNIYEKKGSHSRTEIVAWAIHQHLVDEKDKTDPIGNDR